MNGKPHIVLFRGQWWCGMTVQRMPTVIVVGPERYTRSWDSPSDALKKWLRMKRPDWRKVPALRKQPDWHNLR